MYDMFKHPQSLSSLSSSSLSSFRSSVCPSLRIYVHLCFPQFRSYASLHTHLTLRLRLHLCSIVHMSPNIRTSVCSYVCLLVLLSISVRRSRSFQLFAWFSDGTRWKSKSYFSFDPCCVTFAISLLTHSLCAIVLFLVHLSVCLSVWYEDCVVNRENVS